MGVTLRFLQGLPSRIQGYNEMEAFCRSGFRVWCCGAFLGFTFKSQDVRFSGSGFLGFWKSGYRV